MTTFNIKSLGCRVSQYDGDRLAEKLLSLGIERNEVSPEIFIVNGCSVTGRAAQKAHQLIRSIKRNNPEVKVVLLGEAGVGKSSIIKQYVTKSFDPDIDSSISSKYISKELEISDIDKKLKYNLWDTAGQEKYRSLAKIFYKDANVIVFVYSIDNIKSFEGLKNYWYEEVKSNCLSNVIFGVVGNKNDLYSQAQVNEQEARQWADSIGGIFQLTSAKTDSGIELLFQNLGKKFFNPDFDYKKEDEEAKKNYEMNYKIQQRF